MSEKHVSAFPAVRVEEGKEQVQNWFENDLYDGFSDYVDRTERSQTDDYDFDLWTANGSHATFDYELGEYERGTEASVEISGGKFGVETVLGAFNDLWADSDLGYRED